MKFWKSLGYMIGIRSQSWRNLVRIANMNGMYFGWYSQIEPGDAHVIISILVYTYKRSDYSEEFHNEVIDNVLELSDLEWKNISNRLQSDVSDIMRDKGIDLFHDMELLRAFKNDIQ